MKKLIGILLVLLFLVGCSSASQGGSDVADNGADTSTDTMAEQGTETPKEDVVYLLGNITSYRADGTVLEINNYEYNNQGSLISVSKSMDLERNGQSFTWQVTYTYDNDGNFVSVVGNQPDDAWLRGCTYLSIYIPYCNGNDPNDGYNYYDGDFYFYQIQKEPNPDSKNEYDSNGNLISALFGNDTMLYKYEYDENSNLVRFDSYLNGEHWANPENAGEFVDSYCAICDYDKNSCLMKVSHYTLYSEDDLKYYSNSEKQPVYDETVCNNPNEYCVFWSYKEYRYIELPKSEYNPARTLSNIDLLIYDNSLYLGGFL